MRTILSVIMLMVGAVLPQAVSAESLPLIQNVNAYETMSLNGEWNYIVDVQEEGYYDYRMKPTQWGFFQNAKPQRPEDFGAVNYDCHVWVNGKEVGHHVGGFTPFNYDISDLLIEGENTIIVKVDNKRHAEDVPTQIFDWWNYGGITRDVKLIKVPPVYLEDYNLQLTSLEGRRLSFSVKLNKPEADHTVTLNIPELKIKKTIKTAADGTASISMKAKPQLWCPETPKRYQVEISLDNSTICDSIQHRFPYD